MKLNSRDAKSAMLAAELLLTKEVRNPCWMEGVFKHAAEKSQLFRTAMWIGELLDDAAVHEEKTVPSRFELLAEVYEQIGDSTLGEKPPKMAIAAYDRCVEALSKLKNLKPQDMGISTHLRDVAGKLTILKGKYSSAEDFRDSIRDTVGQKEIHDKERLIQGDERMDELVASAQAAYDADPRSTSGSSTCRTCSAGGTMRPARRRPSTSW